MKIVCSKNKIVDEKSPKTGLIEIERAGFTDELADAMIVEPVYEDVEYGQIWEVNKAYYLKQLELERESTHRQILLKNMCVDVNGHMTRGLCATASEACKWIDTLNESVGEEAFGMCVDVGALNLCGQDIYEYIHTLGERVKAVILRENDGVTDCAMLPFTYAPMGVSNTDWLGVVRGLREIGFDGYLIMEFGDTISAFSPLLRPQVMSLAKSIAEYFKWQIEIENVLKKHNARVLFGAGDMCHNYINNYGDKYPPLFTCDNNKALWGSAVLGLEIKSPEALKSLPEDCAIFICNRYYREIEVQLRDMGITNDIEYFNDEYMPTFYMPTVR